MEKDLSTILLQPWREMVEGGDFATSYTPKPCLAFGNQDVGYAVCDEMSEPLFRFRLTESDITENYSRVVIDSANGLLLVWDKSHKYHYNIYFICKPMTREYFELPLMLASMRIFGFGVSKLSGQYKILLGDRWPLLGDRWRPRHVYTLGGEGSWRSIAEEVEPPRQSADGDAKFFNGNLHWLADINLVCCFDLETELFTSFLLPPLKRHGYDLRSYGGYRLCILEDSLCLCDMSSNLHVDIWRMNNYGDADSWVKEYTFDQKPYISESGRPSTPNNVLPLKVLENGYLLLTVNTDDRLFIYAKNKDAVEPYGLLQRSTHCYFSNIVVYNPTFLSLKSMGIQNVQPLIFY